jgi:hypothetical protein
VLGDVWLFHVTIGFCMGYCLLYHMVLEPQTASGVVNNACFHRSLASGMTQAAGGLVCP